jgi:hypothetical protein
MAIHILSARHRDNLVSDLEGRWDNLFDDLRSSPAPRDDVRELANMDMAQAWLEALTLFPRTIGAEVPAEVAAEIAVAIEQTGDCAEGFYDSAEEVRECEEARDALAPEDTDAAWRGGKYDPAAYGAVVAAQAPVLLGEERTTFGALAEARQWSASTALRIARTLREEGGYDLPMSEGGTARLTLA